MRLRAGLQVLLLFFIAISARAEIVPAPIHSDDLEARILWKTRWSEDRAVPEILGKSLKIDWAGKVRTPKGHPFPALYVSLDIAVPAGAELTTQSERVLRGVHLPADDRDQYTIDLPIHKMQGNSASFFLRLASNDVAEFDVDYSLHLTETVVAVHPSCERLGVTLEQKGEASLPSFLLASCVREDRVLYVNIDKPLDRKFVAGATTRQLLETEGMPVLRIAMRPEWVPRRARLAELRLTDGRHQSHYEVLLQGQGPTGWRLAVGLGPSYVNYVDRAGPNHFAQLPVFGLLSAGYLFLPGFAEVNLDARGTLVPIMLSDSGAKSAASWYELGYHLGFLFPVGEREHVFGAHLGWYHYFMTTPDNAYGLPSIGLTNIAGPQLMFDLRYRPLGSLGWVGYFKYAPVSDTLQGLDLGKFQHHVITLGFSHEVPWLRALPRRPSLLAEGGFLAYELNGKSLAETHVILAFMYPFL